MNFSRIENARSIRDGGIDAIAALQSVLPDALAGLSPEDATALKRTVGNLMGEIVDQLINPAVRRFPELNTDEAAWVAIASERAKSRLAQKTQVG